MRRVGNGGMEVRERSEGVRLGILRKKGQEEMVGTPVKMLRVKKGQEEMVGFALIVVLVAIIGLVLLSLSQQKTVALDDSRELRNLLQAAMEYTTSCSVSPDRELQMKEVLKECLEERECLDGRSACTVVERNLKEMLEAAYPAGGRVEKTYLQVVYNVSGGGKELLVLGERNCSSTKKGGEYFFSAFPGNILLRLEACYVG